MTRTLYELDGRDGRRFSPFSWRTLMALKHKGLEVERIPMKFTDRSCIAPSGQDRVPVLVDGKAWVHDSWAIACHLENTYPDAATLFGGAVGRGEARFINRWVDTAVHAQLRTLLVPDAWQHVHADDRDWFQHSREAMFGCTLAALRDRFDETVPILRAVLEPVRLMLADQPYICGSAPAYGDYILFGSFMWARGVCSRALLDTDDPVYAWRRRMLDLFDGFAAKSIGYDS